MKIVYTITAFRTAKILLILISRTKQNFPMAMYIARTHINYFLVAIRKVATTHIFYITAGIARFAFVRQT